MSVDIATIYVNNEKILKIIDTGSNPQIANVKITASKNTITAKFEGVGGSTNGFSCVLDCEIYNTDYTYTKVSDFELVITAPAPLEAFDGYATVGSNNTINLVYNPYNITTDKKYLTINCKDKTMQEDLNITFEGGASTIVQWDGSYEEISSGYTLTLEGSFGNASYGYLSYQVNNGEVISCEGKTAPIVIEGVETIEFTKSGVSARADIGTTQGNNDIGSVSVEYPVTYTPTQNITLYVSMVGGSD